MQNLASIQPRTSLVKFARSPRTDPPGRAHSALPPPCGRVVTDPGHGICRGDLEHFLSFAAGCAASKKLFGSLHWRCVSYGRSVLGFIDADRSYRFVQRCTSTYKNCLAQKSKPPMQRPKRFTTLRGAREMELGAARTQSLRSQRERWLRCGFCSCVTRH